MVTLVVLQKKGSLTRRLTVSAASVRRAVEIARCGAEEARVVFPINGQLFFVPVGEAEGSANGSAIGDTREGIRYGAMTQEEIEAAYEANLPGSYEAYLDVLRDDMGADEFERYALENCLI